MADLIDLMKNRAQRLRLEGVVLAEEYVCGFTYRIEKGGIVVRYNPDGKSSVVSRSEVAEVFHAYDLAIARQAIRHTFVVA